MYRGTCSSPHTTNGHRSMQVLRNKKLLLAYGTLTQDGVADMLLIYFTNWPFSDIDIFMFSFSTVTLSLWVYDWALEVARCCCIIWSGKDVSLEKVFIYIFYTIILHGLSWSAFSFPRLLCKRSCFRCRTWYLRCWRGLVDLVFVIYIVWSTWVLHWKSAAWWPVAEILTRHNRIAIYSLSESFHCLRNSCLRNSCQTTVQVFV